MHCCSLQLSGWLQTPVSKLPSVVEVSFDTCFESGVVVPCERLDDDEQLSGQLLWFAVSACHLCHCAAVFTASCMKETLKHEQQIQLNVKFTH